MLEKVRLIWIKGLLEPSLDQLARMELGLEPKPDAVDRPFDLLVQRPEQAPHPLPTGTPISHVFDEAGKALLILGEPGAGKTTLLLELTRDLLDRAAQDERHLIPVVFDLSLSRLNHGQPGVQAHPEIVQGAAELHHQIADALLPQAASGLSQCDTA